MRLFDINPFEGPLPISFGMARTAVIELLDTPRISAEKVDNWCDNGEVCIGYNEELLVDHVSFGPGPFELRIKGIVLWTPDSQPDPNPVLLRLDPEPREYLGFLVFPKLGVSTTGFHDDDPDQHSISMEPKSANDWLLKKARSADLSMYGMI